MRSLRGRTFTAWVLCVVVMVISLIAAVSIVMEGWKSGHSLKLSGDILFALLPIFFAVPAALIILRQPRNAIGWLLMTPGLVMSLAGVMQVYLSGFRVNPPPLTPAVWFMVLFTGSSWVAMIFPPLLIPLLFPTGRLLTPRWRWVIYLAVGQVLFFFFWITGTRVIQPNFASWSVNNPIGFLPDDSSRYIMPVWVVMLSVLTVASVTSIVVRYRRAAAVEREQMKWLLYAFALFGLLYVPGLFIISNNQLPVLSGIINLLLALAIIAIPSAMTIAILRYHLFDIDVIIRLTLVYALVTALLGLVYVGGVALLQALFRNLTGQTSDLAVLLTTLAIATLFSPLRQSVQAMINRRFYRQKYNADQALAQFASAARGGSDLDALNSMLIDLVGKTLQPTQAQVLMRTAKPGQAGGSKEGVFR